MSAYMSPSIKAAASSLHRPLLLISGRIALEQSSVSGPATFQNDPSPQKAVSEICQPPHQQHRANSRCRIAGSHGKI